MTPVSLSVSTTARDQRFFVIAVLHFGALAMAPVSAQFGVFDRGLQFEQNPSMVVNTRQPPPAPKPTEDFEIRRGYRLIKSLDEFREAIKQSNQKIRMKPGIYRAKKAAPQVTLPLKKSSFGVGRNRQKGTQEHIFAINGSNNRVEITGSR